MKLIESYHNIIKEFTNGFTPKSTTESTITVGELIKHFNTIVGDTVVVNHISKRSTGRYIDETFLNKFKTDFIVLSDDNDKFLYLQRLIKRQGIEKYIIPVIRGEGREVRLNSFNNKLLISIIEELIAFKKRPEKLDNDK